MEIESFMKLKFLFAAVLAIIPTVSSRAQASISYALPRTVLVFDVEAGTETFHAGPYARYAKKYLGIDVREEDSATCTVNSVRLSSATEADQTERYSLRLSSNALPAFMQLTAQGLVAGDKGSYEGGSGWKFSVPASGEGFFAAGVPANLTSASNTLFGKSNVSVKQSVVVEKSLEEKAREVSDMIFKIRDNRYKILVGDTDATYSGEAMKAALDELSRLEADYMTLFTGYSEKGVQTASFEVVPQADPEKRLYVAFRLSDSEGLVSADDVRGKPYLIEIQTEPVAVPVEAEPSRAKPEQVIYYRIPAVCFIRLTDGVSTLLRTRMPVYQCGITATYPIFKK